MQNLSGKCRRNLREIYITLCQLDIFLAKEICGLPPLLEKSRKTDSQKALLSGDDDARLKASSTAALERYEALDIDKVSLSQIVEELSKTQSDHLTRWQSTATALTRIQSRFIMFDDHIHHVEYCRSRADILLHLAADAAYRLTSVALELRDFNEQLLFAIQFRLSTLQAFDPIWKMLTTAEAEKPEETARYGSELTSWLKGLDRKLAEDEEPDLDYTNSKHRVSSCWRLHVCLSMY